MNAIMYQRIIASGCHSSHSVLVVVVHGEIVSDKGKKERKQYCTIKHQLIILIAAEIIILLLPVLMLCVTTTKVETSFAYVTQSSSGIAAADPSYCDKAGHYPTCYDMGYEGGLIDRQQDVQNGLRYSALEEEQSTPSSTVDKRCCNECRMQAPST
jgi:hypothetical protein